VVLLLTVGGLDPDKGKNPVWEALCIETDTDTEQGDSGKSTKPRFKWNDRLFGSFVVSIRLSTSHSWTRL